MNEPRVSGSLNQRTLCFGKDWPAEALMFLPSYYPRRRALRRPLPAALCARQPGRGPDRARNGRRHRDPQGGGRGLLGRPSGHGRRRCRRASARAAPSWRSRPTRRSRPRGAPAVGRREGPGPRADADRQDPVGLLRPCGRQGDGADQQADRRHLFRRDHQLAGGRRRRPARSRWSAARTATARWACCASSMPGWKDLVLTGKSKIATTTQEAVETVQHGGGRDRLRPVSRPP